MCSTGAGVRGNGAEDVYAEVHRVRGYPPGPTSLLSNQSPAGFLARVHAAHSAHAAVPRHTYPRPGRGPEDWSREAAREPVTLPMALMATHRPDARPTLPLVECEPGNAGGRPFALPLSSRPPRVFSQSLLTSCLWPHRLRVETFVAAPKVLHIEQRRRLLLLCIHVVLTKGVRKGFEN